MKMLELQFGKMIGGKFQPNGSSTIYDLEPGDERRDGQFETDSQGRIDGMWKVVEVEEEEADPLPEWAAEMYAKAEEKNQRWNPVFGFLFGVVYSIPLPHWVRVRVGEFFRELAIKY